ncbi:MAG: DUF4443 domain-containing protein [Candidatus Bathyarchaeia archaeon]
MKRFILKIIKHSIRLSVESLKNLTVKIDRLRALFVLSSYPGVGRKRLSSVLDVGEGYVRNIIGSLKRDGLVREDRVGNFLTSRGKAVVRSISDHLVAHFDFNVAGFQNSKAVLVKGLSEHIKMGLEERDAAIRMGATGALIITCSGGNFWFPGLVNLSDANPELVQSIKGQIKMDEKDVVIITWSKSAKDSERGALNAAIEILEKTGKISALI